jgi:uncharacterized protein YgfB (UPF0149 family)
LALNQTSTETPASEVHGIVCGVISGNSNSKAKWEELITGPDVAGEIHEMLQNLFTVTAKQLDDYLFDFQLLLPGDSEALPLRAEALTLWCQGYLTGLKLAEVQLSGRSEGEVTEAINDIIEIAKMNYEDVMASEEDEAAYTELVEYVRMAAILIYQNLHEQNEKTGASNHLH